MKSLEQRRVVKEPERSSHDVLREEVTGEKMERLRGGAGENFNIYSPEGTEHTISGERGGITEFLKSEANTKRAEDQQLNKKDIDRLKHNQGSSRGWTCKKLDSSKRIQLQHKDGRIVTVPHTQSTRGEFYKKIGLSRSNFYDLKRRHNNSSHGWQLYQPGSGESSQQHEQRPEAGLSRRDLHLELFGSYSGSDEE